MARIWLEHDLPSTEPPASRLAKLGITLEHWPPPIHSGLGRHLEAADLGPREREEILESVDDRFLALRTQYGYTNRDLVVIHETTPDLPAMLQKFDRVHYHEDDEVRYVLAGRGYFGFVEPSGKQFVLEVLAGDYIHIPGHTEHWFEMKDSPRIKAVRYFIDKAGWVPVYTGRARTA